MPYKLYTAIIFLKPPLYYKYVIQILRAIFEFLYFGIENRQRIVILKN